MKVNELLNHRKTQWKSIWISYMVQSLTGIQVSIFYTSMWPYLNSVSFEPLNFILLTRFFKIYAVVSKKLPLLISEFLISKLTLPFNKELFLHLYHLFILFIYIFILSFSFTNNGYKEIKHLLFFKFHNFFVIENFAYLFF